MKIFVLPSWYKTAELPETCIFIYEQVAGLSNLGHQVVVLSPQLKIQPYIRNRTKTVGDGVSKIFYRNYWTVWPAKFPSHNLKQFEKCARKIFHTAVEQCGIPDVIYAHFSSPAGYVATKIGHDYGIPVVVEEHYSGLMQGNMSEQRLKLMSDTIDNSKSFICVSSGLKKSLERQIGSRNNIKVVSNMIHPCFRFSPLSNDKYVFLSIGSLIPRKGFEFLIGNFAKVFKGKDVELRIAGSGPLYKRLNSLIEVLDMKNQVKLIGQLSRSETLQQYKECHCFVLTSQAETFGLVYREALAVGRPVISTKHGGFSEDDWYEEYGCLVDYGLPKSLKSALEHIYNNYNEYDLEKISKLCLSTCSQDVVIKKIEEELFGYSHI